MFGNEKLRLIPPRTPIRKPDFDLKAVEITNPRLQTNLGTDHFLVFGAINAR